MDCLAHGRERIRVAVTSRMAPHRWARLRRRLLEAVGWRCQRCGRPGVLEVHHQRQLRDGGGHEDENLEVLCRACHIQHHKPTLSPEAQAWRDLVDELL